MGHHYQHFRGKLVDLTHCTAVFTMSNTLYHRRVLTRWQKTGTLSQHTAQLFAPERELIYKSKGASVAHFPPVLYEVGKTEATSPTFLEQQICSYKYQSFDEAGTYMAGVSY